MQPHGEFEETTTTRRTPAWQLLLAQLTHFFAGMLWIASLLALLSGALTWGMIRVRILDVPNPRSSHDRPVPRGEPEGGHDGGPEGAVGKDPVAVLDDPGREAVHAAFLIVQHTPFDEFREAMLPHVERDVRRGVLDGQDYATMVDRIRARRGRPEAFQVFGELELLEQDGLRMRLRHGLGHTGEHVVAAAVQLELAAGQRRRAWRTPATRATCWIAACMRDAGFEYEGVGRAVA